MQRGRGEGDLELVPPQALKGVQMQVGSWDGETPLVDHVSCELF